MSRLNKVKKEYPEIDIHLVQSLDPSRTHKFSRWIAKQLQMGFDKNDIGPTISLFNSPSIKHRLKHEQRDINNFNKLPELENLIKDIEASKSSRKIRETKKEKAQKIGELNNYLVYRIDNQAAAVFYGKGTRWCITMENSNYFNNYVSDNNLFYFLLPQNSEEKVAVVVNKTSGKITLYDAADKVIQEHSSWDALIKICMNDADKIPYTKAYGMKEGLLSDEEGLAYWYEVILPLLSKS